MSVTSGESKPWQIKKERRRQERNKLKANNGGTIPIMDGHQTQVDLVLPPIISRNVS